MIRVLINALNESNPGLNLGDDAVGSIEDAFAKLRELMKAGKKYLSIVRFELIRLYEIQHSLRQLSYFDVFGRLRLTLQLARVTLSIPMAIDQAMKDPENAKEGSNSEYNEKMDNIHTKEASTGDSNNVSSDESASSDDDDDTPRSMPAQDDFGMKVEEEDSEEDHYDDGGDGRKPKKQGRADRRAARRARVEAARKARIRVEEEKALQRKGLLGPTAASLLNGVVKVLETSEAWVPGGKRGGSDD